MRIKVHLQEYGTESPEPHTILLNCGAGEQILRWVAYAACGRMAFQKGDVPSAYVPQSVLQADGTILDVDIVLNEMLGDGDELFVEYSHGPTVFKCRWEGRPRTPPHVWGETAVTENVEYDWLSDLDLKAYGLNELINPDLASANAHAVDQDLDATKDIMSQYAGPLQALFIYYGTQGDSPSQEKLSLSQFRDIILDSQIASEKFVPGMIDEAFNKARYAQASVQESGKRRQSAGSKLGLQEFIFALIFVAAKKLDLGFEGSGWGFAALSERFYKLLTEFIFPNLIPAIAERIRAISQPSPTRMSSSLWKLCRRRAGGSQSRRWIAVSSSVCKWRSRCSISNTFASTSSSGSTWTSTLTCARSPFSAFTRSTTVPRTCRHTRSTSTRFRFRTTTLRGCCSPSQATCTRAKCRRRHRCHSSSSSASCSTTRTSEVACSSTSGERR